MKVTEYGRKQVASKECRAEFLTLAITHLFIHRTPQKEFEDGLRLIVAQYLAGTDHKHRAAMGTELNNYEKFLRENTAVIEPLVQEAIEGAQLNQEALKMARG
jgi:hypothetical protein